jgi:hypothetical protein
MRTMSKASERRLRTTNKKLEEMARLFCLSWEWEHPDWGESWGPDETVEIVVLPLPTKIEKTSHLPELLVRGS